MNRAEQLSAILGRSRRAQSDLGALGREEN